MNPPCLMIIDDETGVRESLKMVFSREYRLLEAESIDSAIPQIERERPAVILLDIVMPKTGGMELLKQIKTIHRGCEVIVITGLNTQHVAAKAMEMGAFDFIGKPFDVSVIREKVNRALAKVTGESQKGER